MKTSSRKGIAFRSSNLPYVAAGAVALVAVLIVAVRYGVSSASPTPEASADQDLAALALPPSTSSTFAQASPPSVAAPSATSLVGEITKIRPLLTDTNGPLDRGTASLALWASVNLTWADLKALPATSPALFRKDPEQERGRTLCIEGTIQEIRAEKNLSRRLVEDRPAPLVEAKGASTEPRVPLRGDEHADAGAVLYLGSDDAEWAVPGGKVVIATMVEHEHGKMDDARRAKPFSVEAIAVKSTGSLVDGDSAKFCGILTGVSLSGADGRIVHRAVGMFELPENTGVAPAHSGAPAQAGAPAQ